jgi:nicotinate-nucleotide adenylyltransferase
MGKIAIFGGTFDPVHWGHLLLAEAAASQFKLDRVLWMPDRVPPHKSRPDLASFHSRREMVALAIAYRSDFVLASPPANAPGTSFAIDTLLDLQNLYPDDRPYWIVGIDAFQTLPKWHRCGEIGGLCDWLVAPRPVLSEAGSEIIAAGGMVCDRTAEIGCVTSPAGDSAVFSQNNSVSESCVSPMNALSFPQTDVLVATSVLCCQVAEKMALVQVQISWEVLQMPSLAIASSSIRRYCAEGRSIGCLVPEAVRNYIAAHQLYRKNHQI